MNTEAATEDNQDIMYHGQVAEMRSRVQIALDVQHIRKILENNDSDGKGDNVAVRARNVSPPSTDLHLDGRPSEHEHMSLQLPQRRPRMDASLIGHLRPFQLLMGDCSGEIA